MARATLFGPRRTPRGAREVASAPAPAPAAAVPERGLRLPPTPEALRAAFDYRGNVTLALDDGSALEGYVTNLREDAVELWRPGHTASQAVVRARIRGVTLSGRDPASGRSYATWRARAGAGVSAGRDSAPPSSRSALGR